MANPRTGSTTVRDILDPFSDIRSVNIRNTTEAFPFYHHISALELKKIFKARGWHWDEYKKFTVVRNPFDRVVSLWHHYQWMFKEGHRSNQINSFEEYVEQIDASKRLPTSLHNFICDEQGNELVDDILEFEQLEEQLPPFLRSLHILITAEDIPKLNASKNRKDYRLYYNANLRQRVNQLYADEIIRFTYKF